MRSLLLAIAAAAAFAFWTHAVRAGTTEIYALDVPAPKPAYLFVDVR